MHPRYKTKYRVGNWPAYDRALVQRGDVTLWLTPEAIATWEAVGVGKRGGQLQYSEVFRSTYARHRTRHGAHLSQTAVYDTCGSATPASHRRTVSSRWKLARHGRTLVHLVNIMQDLSARGVGLRVLTGHGAQIDTSAR